MHKTITKIVVKLSTIFLFAFSLGCFFSLPATAASVQDLKDVDHSKISRFGKNVSADEKRAALGLDGDNSLDLVKEHTDKNGNLHQRYNQLFEHLQCCSLNRSW